MFYSLTFPDEALANPFDHTQVKSEALPSFEIRVVESLKLGDKKSQQKLNIGFQTTPSLIHGSPGWCVKWVHHTVSIWLGIQFRQRNGLIADTAQKKM